jgi:hypothetical protein
VLRQRRMISDHAGCRGARADLQEISPVHCFCSLLHWSVSRSLLARGACMLRVPLLDA